MPVFRKSGQWRLWMHKKAPWNVRAWYYGPKRTLPRNLTTYNASWFASQRSRAHRALQKYVRFRGDVVKRAAEVLDALASSKETDLLAVQAGASKCLVGVHAPSDADQAVHQRVAQQVARPRARRHGRVRGVRVAERGIARRRRGLRVGHGRLVGAVPQRWRGGRRRRGGVRGERLYFFPLGGALADARLEDRQARVRVLHEDVHRVHEQKRHAERRFVVVLVVVLVVALLLPVAGAGRVLSLIHISEPTRPY